MVFAVVRLCFLFVPDGTQSTPRLSEYRPTLSLRDLEASRAVGYDISALEGPVLDNPVNDRASVLQ
jgi:hypothetical protein